VKIAGGGEGGWLLWYNLLWSRCGVWCAGYVINGVRLAHDITSSMWDLFVFRPLHYSFMYQKKRRKILDVMAVNCFTRTIFYILWYYYAEYYGPSVVFHAKLSP
jgi:hypothetical protein